MHPEMAGTRFADPKFVLYVGRFCNNAVMKYYAIPHPENKLQPTPNLVSFS